MDDASAAPVSPFAWSASLIGLGLLVFAVVGLSGPGRIDGPDGQSRFEVGRSLIEHGDVAIRDERIQWNRFPGRGGNDFSNGDLPLALLAAGSIWLADRTDAPAEGRRHFFFVLSGAACCGLLSILYAVWFRRLGFRPPAALFWGAGGIFCTPAWFYGTSTSGEYLGTTLVVAAIVLAARTRGHPLGAILAGILFGIAYNVEPSLAVFILVAWALHDDAKLPRGQRFINGVYIAAGLAAGFGAQFGFERYLFPEGRPAETTFANHQLIAAGVLAVSYGAGLVWYFPPLLLCVCGLAARWRNDRRVVLTTFVAAAGFFVYVCSLLRFKGEVCWGPRHLTPLVGVLWLFAPLGAACLPRLLVGLLLCLGVVVQLLGLAVDPNRLYVERDVPAGIEHSNPPRYYETATSHLMQRPREIVELARRTNEPQYFAPALSPTFAFPPLDAPELAGPDVVNRYHVLGSWRFWWSSMTWLPAEERPAPIGRTAAILLAIASAGLLILGATTRRLEPASVSQSAAKAK